MKHLIKRASALLMAVVIVALLSIPVNAGVSTGHLRMQSATVLIQIQARCRYVTRHRYVCRGTGYGRRCGYVPYRAWYCPTGYSNRSGGSLGVRNGYRGRNCFQRYCYRTQYRGVQCSVRRVC